MHRVVMVARVPSLDRRDLYACLSDFESYPAHSGAVRRIDIERLADGTVLSRWEVNFRRGVLRWTEADVFDDVNTTITFQQTAGDIDHFAGRWAVGDGERGAVIEFSLDFDLGLPGLSHILDPIAEQALYENFQQIVSGLVVVSFGERAIEWSMGK